MEIALSHDTQSESCRYYLLNPPETNKFHQPPNVDKVVDVFLTLYALMASTESVRTTRNAVSHKHVLYSEILSVTSVMRKNSRWASSTHFMSAKDSALGSNLGLRISTSSYATQSSGRGSRESELMGAFQELKRAVRDIEGIRHIAREF